LGWAAFAGSLDICRGLVKRYRVEFGYRNAEGVAAWELVAGDRTEWDFMHPNHSESVIEAKETKERERSVRSSLSSTEASTPHLKLKLNLAKQDDMDDDVPQHTPHIHLTLSAPDPSSLQPPHPTTRLIHSLGVLSNSGIICSIIPTDLKAHALTVGQAIRTMNLRVLLSARAVGALLWVAINGVAVAVTSQGTNQTRGAIGDANGHITREKEQDYNTLLNPGMNVFEVCISNDKNERESYSVFINRI
jgi:hypothetical protein